jgi:hypothetical protein
MSYVRRARSWVSLGLLSVVSFVSPPRLSAEVPTSRLRIQIQPVGSSAPLRGGLRISAEPIEPSRAGDRKAPLEFVPLDETVQLPNGRWRITPSLEGYWIESVTVDLPSKDATLSFRAWPAATVAFATTPPAGELNQSVSIGFLAAPSPDAGQPDRGKALCHKSGPRTACEMPIGVFDLRVSCPGFAPAYRWSVAIKTATTIDLGRVAFVPGGSVSGFVEDQEGQSADGVDIALLTSEGEAIREAMPAGESAVRPDRRMLSARSDSRGFFQLTGLAPGQYRLDARPPGGSTASADVVIAKDSESRLPSPMILNDAVVVDIVVDPARAPGGEEWTLTLRSLGSSAMVSETIPGDGSLRLGSIAVGRYLLTVERDQQSFLAREVDVVAPATRFDLQLPLKRLRGRLRLGDSPLSGALVFGGRNGAERVELQSNREGAFEGYLPHGGLWQVDVEADRPQVHRSLSAVEVGGTEESGYTADIQLPDTQIVGTVVDEKLNPVAGAIVQLRPMGTDDSKFSILTDPDGGFEVAGLPEAGVLASALAPGDLGSDPVVLVPDHGRTGLRVQLVLSRRTPFKGQVIWEDTRSPVVGAFVKVTGLGSAPTLSSSMMTTDSAGRFEKLLPASTLTVNVTYGLPGQVASFVRVPLTSTEAPLALPRTPGQLSVSVGRGIDKRTHRIALFRGDALEFVDYLVHTGGQGALSQPEPQGQQIQLPVGLPTGQYTACAIPIETLARTGLSVGGPRPNADRCVVGLLAAGAATHLQLPDVASDQVR